jgi:hypothetical protein
MIAGTRSQSRQAGNGFSARKTHRELDNSGMAWQDFIRPLHFWTVTRCASGCGVTPDDILSFVGEGDGSPGSLLLTDTGSLWGSHCRYLRGSGTAADPDIVRVKRRFRRFTVKRCAHLLVCYRGLGEAGEPVWMAKES